MTRKAGRRAGLLAVLTALALVLTSAPAFAAGGPPAGSGHGTGAGSGGGGGGAGRGGGGETTVSNNLSVPAIFAGTGGSTGSFTLLKSCPTTPPTDATVLQTPTGAPKTGYPINTSNYYFVQGVNTWQAQCYTTPAVTATDTTGAVKAEPKWGDNLVGGSASLKVNSPIRVEMALNAYGASMTGYDVVKLDPNALDRESAYGTLATLNTTTNVYEATPISFPYTREVTDSEGVTSLVTTSVRVYDGGGATLSISGPASVPTFTATAEINATGAVVYGYNWTPTVAGEYTLTFTTSPAVPLVHADGTPDGNTSTITVTVAATAGGGSGGSGSGGQ